MAKTTYAKMAAQWRYLLSNWRNNQAKHDLKKIAHPFFVLKESLVSLWLVKAAQEPLSERKDSVHVSLVFDR